MVVLICYTSCMILYYKLKLMLINVQLTGAMTLTQFP